MYIKQLVWDGKNVAHIALHNVVPVEVEQTCHRKHIEYQSYEGRFVLIGVTKKGRAVAVILSPKKQHGVYYVVTARDASKKERELFRQKTKGGVII